MQSSVEMEEMEKLEKSSPESDSLEEPLQGRGVVFQKERTSQDKAWAVACLSCIVITLVLGFYAVVIGAPDGHTKTSPEYLARPQSCPTHGRRLEETLNQDTGSSSSHHNLFWLFFLAMVLSIAGSLGLGVGYILLFKHIPHVMVHGTFCLSIFVLAFTGIVFSIVDSANGGYSTHSATFFVLAVALVVIYIRRKENINLCARLLGVSTIGLKCNPGLVVFVLLVNVAEAFIAGSIGLLAAFAIYRNLHVIPTGARRGSDACYNVHNHVTACCEWQPSKWSICYAVLAGSTMLWMHFIAKQLRTFVIAGTIAQWYFAPVSQSSTTKGFTVRSVDHAMGPSLGTICFGGGILLVIEQIRAVLYRIRFLYCFWVVFEKIAGNLTKFATIMAAITGEDLLTAGKKSTDLLLRNFLKSFGVWWMPPFVMRCSASLLAYVWLQVILFLAKVTIPVMLPKEELYEGRIFSFIIALTSFVLSWLVLSFFGSILLNIVDATYLCYAMDKDTKTITKQEVHDVFAHVPVGAAVEQPDGEVQYGNPGRYNYVPPSDPDAYQPVHNNTANA